MVMTVYILTLLLVIKQLNLYYSLGFLLIYITYVILAFVQSKYYNPCEDCDDEQGCNTEKAMEEVK